MTLKKNKLARNNININSNKKANIQLSYNLIK